MLAELRAHKRVLGVSGELEVLACGHQIPRFDMAPGHALLVEQGRPAFPQVRACPECPAEKASLSSALAAVGAPPEALAWWSKLGLGKRSAWLDELAPGVDAPRLRSRSSRAPLPEGEGELLSRVLHAAQVRADALGLTLRELSSCAATPPPVLSGWALVRAAARRYEAQQKQANQP